MRYIDNGSENESYFVNSYGVKYNVLNKEAFYLDLGGKCLEHDSFNDQAGGVVSVSVALKKCVLFNLSGEKYFNIKSHKETYPSTFFFNTSLSVLLAKTNAQ